MYLSVSDEWLLPLCWQRMLYTVCHGSGDRRALCRLFNELGLCIWFFWGRTLVIVPAPSAIPTLAHIRCPGTLKPSSNGLSQI